MWRTVSYILLAVRGLTDIELNAGLHYFFSRPFDYERDHLLMLRACASVHSGASIGWSHCDDAGIDSMKALLYCGLENCLRQREGVRAETTIHGVGTAENFRAKGTRRRSWKRVWGTHYGAPPQN